MKHDLVKIKHILGLMGFDPEDTTIVQQACVLFEALRIFQERNARYQDAWKRTGWRGNLVDLRKKIERLWAEFWYGNQENPDDAFDIINFTAFFIRNHIEGNEEGTWNWGIGNGNDNDDNSETVQAGDEKDSPRPTSPFPVGGDASAECGSGESTD